MLKNKNFWIVVGLILLVIVIIYISTRSKPTSIAPNNCDPTKCDPINIGYDTCGKINANCVGPKNCNPNKCDDNNKGYDECGNFSVICAGTGRVGICSDCSGKWQQENCLNCQGNIKIRKPVYNPKTDRWIVKCNNSGSNICCFAYTESGSIISSVQCSSYRKRDSEYIQFAKAQNGIK